MNNIIDNMLASAIVLVIMITIGVIVFYFINRKQVNTRKETYISLHQNLKPNVKVEFAGGLIGKLVKVGEEFCEVELTKGIDFTISRYSITRVIEK